MTLNPNTIKFYEILKKFQSFSMENYLDVANEDKISNSMSTFLLTNGVNEKFFENLFLEIKVNEKCRVYYTNFVDYQVYDLGEQERADLVNNMMSDVKQKIKRGDLVYYVGSGNKEKPEEYYIYDGEKVVCLDYSLHKYGSIPEEFRVFEEFEPNYWDTDPLSENTVRTFSTKAVDSLITNEYKMKVFDKFKYCIELTFKGKEYLLISESPWKYWSKEKIKKGLNKPDITMEDLKKYDDAPWNNGDLIQVENYNYEQYDNEEMDAWVNENPEVRSWDNIWFKVRK